MGRECSLTHTSQRRNRSQEQALPTPATKAVPVWQNAKLPVREGISHSNARYGSAMTMSLSWPSPSCLSPEECDHCQCCAAQVCPAGRGRAHKAGDGCTPRQAEPWQLRSHSSESHTSPAERCLSYVPNQSWTAVTLQDLDHGAPQFSLVFGWDFTRLLCEVHYQIST